LRVVYVVGSASDRALSSWPALPQLTFEAMSAVGSRWIGASEKTLPAGCARTE